MGRYYLAALLLIAPLAARGGRTAGNGGNGANQLLERHAVADIAAGREKGERDALAIRDNMAICAWTRIAGPTVMQQMLPNFCALTSSIVVDMTVAVLGTVLSPSPTPCPSGGLRLLRLCS